MKQSEFEAKYGIKNAKVFIDADNRPYLTGEWNGDPWLFYWHPDNKWVSLRKQADGPMIFVDYLTEAQQESYLR